MTNNFEETTPILNVSNLTRSMDNYVHKLAFIKKWERGDPSTFGCVGRDKVSAFLCEGAQGRPGNWIMVFVQNVDALHAEYKHRGATILQPPTNMLCETRELQVGGPDGRRIRFASDSTGPADPAEVKRFWDAAQFPAHAQE
jgi:hypothetical protein